MNAGNSLRAVPKAFPRGEAFFFGFAAEMDTPGGGVPTLLNQETKTTVIAKPAGLWDGRECLWCNPFS